MPPPPPSAAAPAPTRELTEIDVEFISLVAVPANGRALILKDARGRQLVPRLFALKAGPDELRRAYGIVYPAGDVDSEGDTATASTVRRAADRWMRAGRANQVDRQHSFSQEQAYIAESWIVRAGDPLFPAEAPGAWAVGIQIGDPGLWDQIKAGQLSGLSLAGMVETADLGGDDPMGSVTKGWLSKVIETIYKGGRDVTSDEVKKLIKESVPDVTAAVREALKADQRGQTQDINGTPSEKPAPVTKADVSAAVAEAVATLKGDLEAVVKAELTTALTKGAPESDSAGLLPMGERETGGLL